MIRVSGLALAAAAAIAPPLASQSQKAVEPERHEFADWVRSAPVSPRRAVAVRPIGAGLTLGPDSAEVPLAGVAAGTLTQEGGRVRLQTGAVSRTLVRGKPISLGPWQLVVSGPSGRAVLTVFGAALRSGNPPEWFPYDSAAVLTVTLLPSHRPDPVRLLAPDGVEVDATEAGSVTVVLQGKSQPLRVFRMPGAADEESELEIYFRDATSGQGTYPAGRFVSLIPAGANRYVLDLNRARNPFCAYNTVYPCPAPWRGNVLSVPVRAGEKYPGER